MKKQLTLIAAVAAANVAMANDFDQFLADSTVDVKARSIYVSMNPNDVAIDTTYSVGMLAALLIELDPTQAAYFAGLVAGNASDPTDVATGLGAAEGVQPGTIATVNAAINSGLVAEVEKQGTLDQAGSALWVQMESGYLFDIIGFDLGFQGSMKHFKEDESDDLILKPGDDGYSRLSTARIKARYGSDDVYVKGHYGYYSDATETDYLMDNSDLDYEVSAHYYDFSLSLSSTLASSDETSSEFDEEANPSKSLELAYSSDYGNASASRSFTDSFTENYSDSYEIASGLPLSLLGLPVAEDKMMDYLLLGQLNYNTSDDDTSDYKATLALELDVATLAGTYFKDSEEDNGAYELTAAVELEGITLAAAYNQNSDAGSRTGVADLPDELLINDDNFEKPEQTATSLAVQMDGSLIGVDGLSVSVIHVSGANTNMDSVLADGETDYYLTADAAFTETLVDAKYSFSDESFLKGLSLRTVFGGETNQANVSGYGVFVDYDLSF